MDDWKPSVGQVALIELDNGGDDCFTGIVLGEEDGHVVIDLGASPRPSDTGCEVIASFFDPDALYRVQATLLPREDRASIIDLTVHDVQRVQRRVAARAKLTVPITLSNFDDIGPAEHGGEFSSVTGESIDVGEGGCRVVVNKAFPRGCDPTVALHLSPGETLLALAAVLEERRRPDGRFDYRLVFIDQDDGHRERLASFLATV